MTKQAISNLTPAGSMWYHRTDGTAVRVTATRRGLRDKTQIWVHYCADRHYAPGNRGYLRSLIEDFFTDYRPAS